MENVELNYLEDLVFRMELTYNKIEYIIDVDYIAALSFGNTPLQAFMKNSDLIVMTKSSLPKETRVKITIDDIRLR